MQEAKFGEPHREQPRGEPETADADLLRLGSDPRLGLFAILFLGFDLRLKRPISGEA
jgi:hypothetical protein